MVTSKPITPYLNLQVQPCRYILDDIVHYTSSEMSTMFRPGFVALFVYAVASQGIVGQFNSMKCLHCVWVPEYTLLLLLSCAPQVST